MKVGEAAEQVSDSPTLVTVPLRSTEPAIVLPVMLYVPSELTPLIVTSPAPAIVENSLSACDPRNESDAESATWNRAGSVAVPSLMPPSFSSTVPLCTSTLPVLLKVTVPMDPTLVVPGPVKTMLPWLLNWPYRQAPIR